MEKSVSTTMGLSKQHLMILGKWKESTGLSRSRILRMVIEKVADYELSLFNIRH